VEPSQGSAPGDDRRGSRSALVWTLTIAGLCLVGESLIFAAIEQPVPGYPGLAALSVVATPLLLLGGLAVFFTMFVGPRLLHLSLSLTTRQVLYTIGGVLVVYGLLLTVVPDVWTPFAAGFNVPNIGWVGVFAIAAIFDVCAALIAFFVLRRMEVPQGGEQPAVEPVLVPAVAGAAD
jgi:energy-converting hydrogenase Eha subunit E